jgi:hypothetical protein
MPARLWAPLLAGPAFVLCRILWGVWTHPVPPATQLAITLSILLLLTLLACTCHVRFKKNR